jgi:hypothetical protein
MGTQTFSVESYAVAVGTRITTGIQGLGGIPNPVALRKYDDFRTIRVACSTFAPDWPRPVVNFNRKQKMVSQIVQPCAVRI